MFTAIVSTMQKMNAKVFARQFRVAPARMTRKAARNRTSSKVFAADEKSLFAINTTRPSVAAGTLA